MEAKPLVPAAQYVRMSTEDQQFLGNRGANAGSMHEDSLLNREYGFGFDTLFRNLVPHVHFQSVDAWL